MQRIDGSERHRPTPRSGIVARRLRAVARKHHPTVPESHSAIEIDKIIAILTFESLVEHTTNTGQLLLGSKFRGVAMTAIAFGGIMFPPP